MLTPIDIQNRTLKTTMGGYNRKDTDDFLASILESYEELYKENHDLKEKVSSLSDGIQYYKQMENTLQKALILAEKTSTETQEAAKSQADAMLKEAKAKADSIINDTQTKAEKTTTQANRELEDTRNHIRKLAQSYENYRLQFKKLAESQIEMLDSGAFSIYAPELDELIANAPSADEAAATTNPLNVKMENVATEEVEVAATDENEYNDVDENEQNVTKEIDDAEEAVDNASEVSDTVDDEMDAVDGEKDITDEETECSADEAIDENGIPAELNNGIAGVEWVDENFTTPVVGEQDKPDISDTVFPASDTTKSVPSYLMDNTNEEQETAKEENPFTFIDPE